jgi:hypothetical protein
MPTKRTRRTRARRAGSVGTPALVSMLADDCRVELTVRLAIALGDPMFAGLNDKDEADVEKGIETLRRLWPLHSREATEYCISHDGPGHRPTFWWEHDSPAPRPYVRPYDWRDGDLQRFEQERAAADIAFLEKHNLLTPQEKLALAEMKTPRRFGLEPEEED